MVKGISRRVVIIKSPDTELFDEAIFLVRDDAARDGVTREELLREAAMVATGDAGKSVRKNSFFHYLIAALLGASVTGAAWIATLII